MRSLVQEMIAIQRSYALYADIQWWPKLAYNTTARINATVCELDKSQASYYVWAALWEGFVLDGILLPNYAKLLLWYWEMLFDAILLLLRLFAATITTTSTILLIRILDIS